MPQKRKTLKEEFAKFYEQPSREMLRELLRDNLGEFPNIDFKQEWPTSSRLARHILGLSNSGGGCIIIGVAENADKTLDSKGLEKLEDKASIINGIKRFLPSVLIEAIEIGDFFYEASEYPKIQRKKFQSVFVPDDSKHLPFVSLADGDGIRNSAIYVRRGPSTDEANYDELQKIINRRLETGYSSQREIDIREHMEQLKMLYANIDKYHVRLRGGILEALEGLELNESILGKPESTPNPKYPGESLEEFIIKTIEKKKKRIQILLDVLDV